MPQLVAFGETMACFTPLAAGSLRYVPEFRMRIAGAESNVAIGVAKLGHTAGWMSSLGDDPFGEFVCASIRAEGVDTSRVHRDASRPTGIMFKQFNPRGESEVFYYRHGSAASSFVLDDQDVAYIRDAQIFHVTGITPVLGPACCEAMEKAVDTALRCGVKVSFDPNIRRKLWRGQDYSPLLRRLCAQSSILLLGLEEAQELFGQRDPEKLCEEMFRSPFLEYAALKDGANGAWVATAAQLIKIAPQACDCVDPIGAGDAFNAGFLSGILDRRDLETCGRMGAVAGAMATQTQGDIEGYPSFRQLQNILQHNKTISR